MEIQASLVAVGGCDIKTDSPACGHLPRGPLLSTHLGYRDRADLPQVLVAENTSLRCVRDCEGGRLQNQSYFNPEHPF